MWKRILLVLSLLVPNSFATASDIEVIRDEGGPSFITVRGEFVSGDAEKFNNIAILEKTAVVVFDSPGGLAMVGTQIGTTIHIKGFATAVLEGSMCASSCGLAWLAGSPRIIIGRGLVGFHAIHTIDNGRTDISSAGNAVVGSYLQQLGMGLETVIYVTKESPQTMQWLTEADASRLGLPVVFEPSRSTNAPANAPEISSNPPTTSRFATPPQGANENNAQVSQPAQPVPFNPSPQWQVLEHADMPGQDLPGMPIDAPSAEFCQAKCASVNGCVAFTQNLTHSKCFLKAGTANALQYSGATSGYYGAPGTVARVGADPGPFIQFRTSQGHEITSPPLTGFHSATLAWCQETCISRLDCRAFNFYPNGDCTLLPKGKPNRISADVYSGFKLQ